MIYFYGKNQYLNSEKLDNILDKKKKLKILKLKKKEIII